MPANRYLFPITPETKPEQLTSFMAQDKELFVIFLPDRFTTQQELEAAHQLIQQVNLPPTQYLEIPINSIVQKAWRIIKHYQTNATQTPAQPKQTPDRKAANRQLTDSNRQRLQQLSHQVKTMILADQALLLNATLVEES